MARSVAIIGTRGYPSYYGGFETAVRKLAPFLCDQGWDVTVYGRAGSTRDADLSRDPRVKTIVTRGVESRSVSTLSYGLTASLDAIRAKPDVALVMNVANGYFLPLLKARGIPSLVNVDGIEWDRDKWGRVAKSVFHTGARATARFGTEMVFDSLVIADRWKTEFRRDGHFIPYGGDTSSELPIEPGLTHRGYVLVVARFVPENTVAQFVSAVELLDATTPVVVVGSSGYGGPLEDSVRDLAARRSNVRWLGHLSDDARLHSLWQHAGVYFHGHTVGGTNPALVQAMACGAPVVAVNTNYNREVLGSPRNLVAASPSAIAARIRSILADHEAMELMSSQNIVRAIDTYSWAKVCGAYESALRRLANRPKRSRTSVESHRLASIVSNSE